MQFARAVGGNRQRGAPAQGNLLAHRLRTDARTGQADSPDNKGVNDRAVRAFAAKFQALSRAHVDLDPTQNLRAVIFRIESRRIVIRQRRNRTPGQSARMVLALSR